MLGIAGARLENIKLRRGFRENLYFLLRSDWSKFIQRHTPYVEFGRPALFPTPRLGTASAEIYLDFKYTLFHVMPELWVVHEFKRRCLYAMQYDGRPTTCKIHFNPLGFQKNGVVYDADFAQHFHIVSRPL